MLKRILFPLFPYTFFLIFTRDTSKSGLWDGQKWGWTPLPPIIRLVTLELFLAIVSKNKKMRKYKTQKKHLCRVG